MKTRLSELIAKSEGDYDSYNRGNAGDSVKKKVAISEMSIKDVRRFQGLDVGDSKRFFAVGKYQIVPDTMDELFDTHKFQVDQNLAFSPEVQEAMFIALISKKRPNIHKYITAENPTTETQRAALLAASQEWASIENPKKEGQMLSFYEGKGGNKANISVADVKAALLEERALYQSHIKDGLLPQDAFAFLNSKLPKSYIETRLTAFKTEKTDLTADINVVKGQKKTILELGEHLKSHSFDNLKDVQKLDALAKTAGIELVTPAEAILADKNAINLTNKADITALQNVLFERGLITSPSRGIFGAQTKNALIKEFDLPQNHTFGNELAAEYLEKLNPKTIEAIQEKVDLALSKVQKNLTTLENKMIVIDQSITALEAKRVALNDPTIENSLEAQHAAKVAEAAEVEIENPQNLQNTQNTESELAKLQDDLVLKQTMITELEQKLADLTALTAQVPDQQIEKPDLKIDLLEVENKEILLTMTESGMSFNINGKDHDASYFNQLQVGITDTQSTYRNENNTLLAKYEYESDQFSIFHKNPYTVDKIAVISDFSEQNTINLVSFDAVKTQSLEKQKSLGKEC